MKPKHLLAAAALALLLPSCGGNRYGDFQKALRHQYRMMEKFTGAAREAAGPEEAAAALERFRKDAVRGREWMVKLTTEHPALADLERARLPEGVKAELAAIADITPRFEAALTRIVEEYGADPEVRKVLEELASVLSLPGD